LNTPAAPKRCAPSAPGSHGRVIDTGTPIGGSRHDSDAFEADVHQQLDRGAELTLTALLDAG
jgi:hypothetical protein